MSGARREDLEEWDSTPLNEFEEDDAWSDLSDPDPDPEDLGRLFWRWVLLALIGGAALASFAVGCRLADMGLYRFFLWVLPEWIQ